MLQDNSAFAKIERSAEESLSEPGAYIIYFEESATEIQQKHFVRQLIRHDGIVKFGAKVIAEYPIIKCLTARLSQRALQWVSE